MIHDNCCSRNAQIWLKYNFKTILVTCMLESNENLSKRNQEKMREASVLAMITSHPNIVRYYTSWMVWCMVNSVDELGSCTFWKASPNLKEEDIFESYETLLLERNIHKKDHMIYARLVVMIRLWFKCNFVNLGFSTLKQSWPQSGLWNEFIDLCSNRSRVKYTQVWLHASISQIIKIYSCLMIRL